MPVDEVGGDVRVNRLGLVRVHDRATPEELARAAVRRQDGREEPAGARLGDGDRRLAAAQARLDRPHALLELSERGRLFGRHGG